MSDGLDTRRRQALFRAQRRGFRELDLVFDAFVKAHLKRLDADQLGRFEALLSVPDWQIYDWITGNATVPNSYDNEVFALLRDYRNNLAS